MLMLEVPPIAPGSFALYGAIPGWTSIGSPLEIQNNFPGAGTARDGSQFTELDGTSNTIIFQEVPTADLPALVLVVAAAGRGQREQSGGAHRRRNVEHHLDR